MKHSFFTLALLTSACSMALGPPPTRAEALPVTLFDSDGRNVGTATLTGEATGLRIVLEVAGLPPGSHAVHVHEHGRCERPDFLSAGAHLDDGAHKHGRLNPAGPHLGDLEDLLVGPDGRGHAELRLAPARGRFVPKIIFGDDGSAIIIHAGPDDGRTDPSGASGPRIACGIVI